MRNEKATATAVGAPDQTVVGPNLRQRLLPNTPEIQTNASRGPSEICTQGSLALGVLCGFGVVMVASGKLDIKYLAPLLALTTAMCSFGIYGMRMIRAQAARPTSAAQDNKPVAACESDADHCESGVTTISSNH